MQAGVPFQERDLRRQPLSAEEIRELLAGRPALTLYATRGRQNRELGIEPERLSDDELIDWMAREPRLIRRPTLVVDGALIPQPRREELARLLGTDGQDAMRHFSASDRLSTMPRPGRPGSGQS